MKNSLQFHIDDRNSYAKLVFGSFLLILIYLFHASAFLVYTFGQPMKGPDGDYVFWLSYCIGFPHFIINHYWTCCLVDVGIAVLTTGCFFSNGYRHHLCKLLILFFFMQRITIEGYSCSHTKGMSCIFVALLPFCFKNDTNFKLMVEAGRYFLLFILCSSAFYKFFNGALMHPTNFVITLIDQHSDLAILNPQHICYKIASQLIAHPKVAATAYILLFLTQVSFLIGFFTKKADRILFIFLLGFAITTYYIMRIYNFDITILGLTLLFFTFSSEAVKNSKKLA